MEKNKKNSKITKFCQGYKETESLRHCWWEYKMVQTPQETIWQVLKTQVTTYNPVTVFLGIHPRERKTCLYNNLYANIYSSFACNNKKLKTIQMCFHRWRLNKLWSLYAMRFPSAEETCLSVHTAAWVKLQRDTLVRKKASPQRLCAMFMWHSWNGNILELEKTLVVAKG